MPRISVWLGRLEGCAEFMKSTINKRDLKLARKSKDAEPMIIAKGLTKTYGDFKAVDGIDFQFTRAPACFGDE